MGHRLSVQYHSACQPLSSFIGKITDRAATEPALYVRTVQYDSSAENKHQTRNISWYWQINTIYRGKHLVAIRTQRAMYSITAYRLSYVFLST